MKRKTATFIGWVALLLAGVACQPEAPTDLAMAFDQQALSNRAMVVDRFDYLTQKEDLVAAEAFIDSIEQLVAPPAWLIWSLHDIRGRFAELHGNLDQSLFEINQLIRYFEENKAEESVLTQAYFRRGDLLMQMRQFDLAFQDFFRGVGKGDLARDACLDANFNYRLGMVSYKQSNFSESQRYFQQSFALFDSCADAYSAMYRRQEVASNIGLCYLRMQRYDSSLYWFDVSMEIVERLPIRNPADEARAKVARWVTYGNKGIALYENRSYGAGRKFMRESYESNIEHAFGDKGHGAFVGNTLAAYLIREKRLNEAFGIMQRLEQSDILKPNSQVLHKALLNRLNYFEATGQRDSLWPYFLQYNAVADSISYNDRQLVKMNTSLLLRGLDKDYALRIEQDRSEARLQLNQAVMGLLVLGLLVLIGVVVTLRRSRRQNEQLAQLNQKVQEQNGTLEATMQQLTHANEELSVLNHQQSRLLRVVAHDLRNPLAAIHSMSLMRLEETSQTDESKEFFRLAVKACQGGLDLINDLLDSMETQPTDGRPLVFTELALQPYLEDTLKMVQHRATEKNIQINLVGLDPHWRVRVDVERFRRALINLITNAIKFSPEGGLVEVGAEMVEGSMRIFVRDQGIGIPAEAIPRLFDAFTTVKRYGTAGEKPFGLGLSITKHIVQLHQAEILVESSPGKGTQFIIQLPSKASQA